MHQSSAMRPLRSNDPCWCMSGKKYKRCHGDSRLLRRPRVELGTVSPMLTVPDHIARPDYIIDGHISTPRGYQIQTEESVERLRRACQVGAEVLLRTGAAVAPGVTTEELDVIAHDAYIELGAYPSTLGYKGFPKSICTSVNGVICHGIPDSRPLRQGDIVNIDVTAFVEGMHGDTSATYVVGSADVATVALVEATRQATLRGVAAVRPGLALQCVADAIDPYLRSLGFGVVREYGGHGIGETFHAAPHVNHSIDRGVDQRDTTVLEPAMTFTIEPMVTSGRPEFTRAVDGWTEHVDDSRVSAQFEHTVLVTPTGVEILTVTAAGETAVGTLEELPGSTGERPVLSQIRE